ncbi:hypothetical protein PFZ55_44615 [Streptomyces sp. MS2A]|nr:hypothetical protein [Streptomyces sp. MS2A]
MDPFWAVAAEFWWTAPVVAGAGAVSAFGIRRLRISGGRRLAYDAARLDLQAAQKEATSARHDVRVARAELARALAERTAGRLGAAEVAETRRLVREAERAAKASAATVRARRAQLDAARAGLAGSVPPDQLPLPRTMAQHDAVVARWMQYETDPARAIAFPSMTDAREPATAAFLAALDEARRTRPDAAGRVTPAEYAAYRDAVAAAERAFAIAERTAQARAGGRDPEDVLRDERAAGWQDAAQQMIAMSADALDRAAGAAASAFAAWNERSRRGRDDDDEDRGRGRRPR